MPHLRLAANFPKGHEHQTPTAPAAGPRGITRMPPHYGIEFVDRAAGGEGPLQLMPRPDWRRRGQDIAPVLSLDQSSSAPNRTGLPDHLKAGIESISGFDMSNVQVHYNSSKPAQLHALAYTQGTDIHVAPGQEQHLPHEAWHVVQQAQGRVRPRFQLKGEQVNDDQGLEQEAETMGAKALHIRSDEKSAREFLIQATPRVTPIQRLMTGANLLAATDPTIAGLQQIGNLLDEYNQVSGNPHQTTKRFNRRFALLRQIDRSIYQWFDAVTAAHANLASDPHTAQMQALLTETENEHIQLVNQTKNKQQVMPFDTTGMTIPEQQQLTALWRSIVQGTGKIQLVGSVAYKRKVRSELAKILDTSEGRNLLRHLNTPTPTAPLADAMSNVYIGEDVNQLPAAVLNDPHVSTDLHNLNQSEAQPLGADKAAYQLGNPQPLAGDEDLVHDFQPLNNAAEFRSALLTGKQGVVLNHQKYLFGAGTGSFVQTVTGAHAIQYDDNLNEILKPDFVTLGHELGHSANMRAGATTLGKDIYRQAEFGEAFSGKSPTETKLYWDNSEEFFNITNWENAIRAGHGLTARGGHKSRGAILRTQRNNQLLAALTPIHNIDPVVDRMPSFKTVADAVFDQAGALDNDAVFNNLSTAITNLGIAITPVSVQSYKALWLQGRFAELQNARHQASWTKRKDTRTEWRAVRQEINNNLAHYTAAGNEPAFTALQNRLKRLRQQHHLLKG